MATFTAFGREYPSEREAILGLMNGVQVAEACAGTAIGNWIKTCKIPELRGGLKIIAEREAFHGRVFQQRVHDLGPPVQVGQITQGALACVDDVEAPPAERGHGVVHIGLDELQVRRRPVGQPPGVGCADRNRLGVAPVPRARPPRRPRCLDNRRAMTGVKQTRRRARRDRRQTPR